MYLNKILPLLFSPIVIVLFLTIMSVVFRRRLLTLAAFFVLFAASLPIIANHALLLAQGDLVRLRPDEVPTREAVVVLAGSLTYTQGTREPMPEWGGTIDRIFAGIELIKEQRAERIVFSSGEYSSDEPRTEGELARDLALTMGIAESQITLSSEAANTFEEARLIRALFDSARPAIILVTSARHVPRAKMIFERAGFDVTPFPVDIDISRQRHWHELWLPEARALLKTDTAVRELLGQAYYRVLFLLKG